MNFETLPPRIAIAQREVGYTGHKTAEVVALCLEGRRLLRAVAASAHSKPAMTFTYSSLSDVAFFRPDSWAVGVRSGVAEDAALVIVVVQLRAC
jgi:hypothetical protein